MNTDKNLATRVINSNSRINHIEQLSFDIEKTENPRYAKRKASAQLEIVYMANTPPLLLSLLKL